MSAPIRVALIQQRSARDVRSWSGILHFSKTAVQRHVGPVVDLSPGPLPLAPLRVVRGAVRLVSGRSYSYDHDPLLARYYGRYFGERIARESPDLVFAPAGSACAAFLSTEVPIIYYSDATWRVMQGYYSSFSNPVARTRRGGEELECRTIGRAALALFSSGWAASSAVRDYGADPARVHDVSIGANLPDPPRRDEVLPRALGPTIRLLLVGVNWRVKGGEIALDALRRLLELGYDAELTVLGCRAPRGVSHPRMRVIPFLNKQNPADRRMFESAWRSADFFLLPTRFDATPVVLCEAAAYGLPALATRTGGVGSVVRDGRNGYTLPHEAGGAEYAARIVELVEDPEHYARLCESSRDEYELRLNWDAWGRAVAGLIREHLPALANRLPE